MTPKISLITAVGAVALVLGAPAAFGKGQPAVQSPDAFERAVLASELSSRIDATVYRDAFERAVAGRSSGQVEAPVYRDAFERAVSSGTPGDRSRALNRLYGLGEYASTPLQDAFERAVVASNATTGPSDRSVALNRTYGLGDFASSPMGDVHDRVGPISEPVSTPIVGSGRDVEWPQIGIGFGVGILLALALGMAMRLTGIRRLAH